MQILVGWDDPQQADLVSSYLSVADHKAIVVHDAAELMQRLNTDNPWDVVLLSIRLPDIESGFETFRRIRQLRPDLTIVGACLAEEIYRVVRFMTHGMSAYVIRDRQGDYLFMLLSVVESAVEAVRAARDRELADRLRAEVQSVRKLQELMIPAYIDTPDGYNIVARYEPSQIHIAGSKVVTMAGGDYYDVFTLDKNFIVLLVGDASGHGMRAAMSIMVMHTLVRMIRTQHYHSTGAFVAEINNQLCQHSVVNDQGGFITLCYGLLELDANRLQWTSAGHPIPLVQNLTTGRIHALESNTAAGIPLAIYPDVEYDSYTIQLPERYRLLFYTDGLQEAFPLAVPTKRGEFGVDGIVRTLQSRQHESVTDALQALFDDSDVFTEGSGRHDDASVVLLERNGSR